MIGGTYVFEVRATDKADNLSSVGISAGVKVFPFDIDASGTVEGPDFDALFACSGPSGAPFPTLPVSCANFDVDADGDVDQSDFGTFQRCISGEEPLDLGCLP